MQKVIVSKQFGIKWRDIAKGIFMSVLVPVLVAAQGMLENPDKDFNWNFLAKVAIGAFIGYMLKNFFDKPKVVITAKSNKEAEMLKNNL
jgi:membrane-bound acyltransferase YfiQ involved in biofilm formation